MTDAQPTRTIIACDEAIYLRGLAALLTTIPGVQLIGEAHTGPELLQLCSLTRPELVLVSFKRLLDLHSLVEQVRRCSPHSRLVLLGELGDEPEQEGLSGLYYFSREMTEQEFKAALEQVRRDGPIPAQPVFRHMWEEEDLLDSTENQFWSSAPLPARSEKILACELVMAGKIQSDILPEEPPTLPGWEICGRLEPARETSGDFYDFIPLTEHKWGLLVADVTDKGMGAALFMALSSTLMRTYAARFPSLPALTLSAVSDRILSDTRGNMFVTAFYGILEPHTGRLIFANAGHPPGFLICTQRGRVTVEPLRPTGMALGVSENAQWKQKVMRLSPGDLLVLYTDGVTEAQNPQGEFFGEERLLDVALELYGAPARQVQDALLKEVHSFVAGAPRQDDIALIVVRRE